MLKFKKIVSLFLILGVLITFTLVGSSTFSASGTGVGLAEHALNAYYSNWSYVYGGASAGAVDCSGLIYMYAGNARGGNSQFNASLETGSTAYGIPNIHGLGLWEDGHVGVYVGNGMAVDARGDDYGICYQSAYTKNWTMWYKVYGVTYPTTGWEYFIGNYYYYENGEYLTNTSVTIDGVTYYLDASGASSSTPGDMSAVAGPSYSTSDTNSVTSSVLKVGSSGDRVIELQQRLTELGFYSGDITGYFGSQTEAAYIRFQTAAGVYVDGIAGDSDLELLYSDNAPFGTAGEDKPDIASVGENADNTDSQTDNDEDTPTTYTSGDYSDEVYLIQAELTELGYFDDEATGYYGSMTESAVMQFQLQNGLEATGDVDELTYTTLFSSKALENPNTEGNRVQTATAPTSTEPVGTTAPGTVSSTEATEIVDKSVQFASKALEGVNIDTDQAVSTGSSRTTTFVVWLIVMIAFMSAAFWFVFSTQKKKQKARYERIKARANRSW